MHKFSFLFLLSLNKNKSPRPALQINPARQAPKPMLPLMNNSATIIDAAQFGISPTKVAITGEKYFAESNAFEITSCPIK